MSTLHKFYGLDQSPCQNKTKGFTLIEVMVALAVLSIGIIAIVTTITHVARNQSLLEEKVIATWVAENRFAYLKSLDEALSNIASIDKGSELMAGRRWFYQEEILSDNDSPLQRVKLSVFSAADSSKVIAVYYAYIAKPGRPLQ